MKFLEVVGIDLEKFFDNVPQDKLMYLVGKTVKDPDVISLVTKYLRAGVMVKGKLGFSFVKMNGKWEARPHKDSINRFKRKLKKLTYRSWSVSMDYRILRLNQVIRGWINYFRIGKMKQNMTKIDKHLRNRMRIVIWKQWKTSKKRMWGLRKLGVPEWMARQSVGFADHYQAVAKTAGLRKIINTRSKEYKILKRYWKIPLRKNWELNSIYFYKNIHFKNMTSSVDILDYMLRKFPNLKEAHDFYQNFLLSISNNDVAMLEDILNTRTDEIPMCFRKSVKTLKKLRKYVVNSLK